MIRRTIALLFISIPSVISAFSQTGTLTGIVKDAYSNESLPGASIVLFETTTGTTSDTNGRYEFRNLKPGFVRLQVSYMGYAPLITEEIMIPAVRPAYYEITLTPSSTELGEVTITADPFETKIESPLSMQRIGIDIIEKGAGSARDLSKVLQSFPGVSNGSSFRNDLVVRGGGPAENRFFLDGIEIPVLNHFSTQGASGGAISMLNVDFIREVEFYSGAFPASRGNALSSVFEFRQIAPNPDDAGFKATLGASELSFSANLPFSENSATLVSARRSYLKFLFDMIGLPFLPTYNDFQVMNRTKIGQRNEITFIGVGAIDEFALNTGLKPTEENKYILSYLPAFEQWNYTVGASYKHFFNESYTQLVLSRSHLYNTIYKYRDNDNTSPDKLITDYKSNEIENKLRFEYFANPGKWTLNAGAGTEYAVYTNNTLAYIFREGSLLQIDYDSRLEMVKWAFFASVSRRLLNDHMSVSAGFRADANNYSSYMNNPLDQFSPRVSASYTLLPSLTINGSAGRFFQLPSYTTLGFRDSNDVTVNRGNGLKYIQADHLVGGLEWKVSPTVRASIEYFYKEYDNYPVAVIDGISLASKGADYGVTGDEEVVPVGSGYSRGFELLLQKRSAGGLNYLLSYTRVTSRFSDINGRMLPSSWDNDHLLTFTLTKSFNRNWDAGFKWRYAGALPYTPLDIEQSELKEAWDLKGREYLDYSRFNSERLEPFHQLDVRIDRSYYFDKVSLAFYLDIQNLYNFQSKNAPRLLQQRDANDQPLLQGTNPERYVLKELQTSTGTVLPSIGIIVEF